MFVSKIRENTFQSNFGFSLSDIIKDGISPYTNEKSGQFATVVVFDCRGVSPTDFSPRVIYFWKLLLVFSSHIILQLSLLTPVFSYSAFATIVSAYLLYV